MFDRSLNVWRWRVRLRIGLIANPFSTTAKRTLMIDLGVLVVAAIAAAYRIVQ